MPAQLAERFRVFAFDLGGRGRSDWPGAYSLELMRDDVLGELDQLGLQNVVLTGHSIGAVVANVAMRQPERPDEMLDFDWAVVPAIVTTVNGGDPGAWRGLASVTSPTPVIGGGEDSQMPQDKLAEVAARIPRCDLVTIPARHHVHTARPAEYGEIGLAWLGT